MSEAIKLVNPREGEGVDRKPEPKPETEAPVVVDGFGTDADAAKVLWNQHRDCLGFNPSHGWLVWDDRRWLAREQDAWQIAKHVGQYYRDMAQRFIDERRDSSLVKRALSKADRYESTRGIRDLLAMAEGMFWGKPEDFDAHPLKLNCMNVTLDFEDLDGEVPKHYEHYNGDLLTKLAPREWIMDARCPKWHRFLKDILPSEALRDFVQVAVGYSLLGTTCEQCFMICYGSGCNGKSTFLNVLSKVIGPDYAAQADPRSLMVTRPDAIRNDLADLAGIRFLSGIETGSNARLDEALVKAVTGGDPIRARHLYREAFTFTPEFTLWLGTNHLPIIRGTDYAIWRRVRLLPFTETIPEDKRDRRLEEKLMREADGIFAWAVEGAVKYVNHGLPAPDEVTHATKRYREGQDTLKPFFDECCVVQPACTVSKGDLYAVYKRWAEDGGEHAKGIRKFGEALLERYPSVDGCDGAGHKRMWMGIGLKV